MGRIRIDHARVITSIDLGSAAGAAAVGVVAVGEAMGIRGEGAMAVPIMGDRALALATIEVTAAAAAAAAATVRLRRGVDD